ncbi:MAG: HD domain-containing protein [Spirochaetes bacterium]|nr:HD domain-containing protein [Spirochaetota bacterium]
MVKKILKILGIPISLVKKFFYSILTAGRDEDDEIFSISRVIVINVFLIIGVIITFAYGLLNIFTGNTLVGIVDLIACAGMILNAVYLRYTARYNRVSSYTLLLMLALLMVLLITGGTANTGIYWFYTYPALTFFLKGKKRGIIWLVYLYLCTFLVLIFDKLGYIQDIPFTLLQMRQMLVSLLVVSLLVYFHERVKNKSSQIIKEKNIELNSKNDQLLREITKRKELHFEIQIKNKLLKNKEAHLTHLVEEKTQKIDTMAIAMVSALENVNLYNDSDTGKHIKRVSGYSTIIAEKYGCDNDYIKRIQIYASLHDVGKIGIPDEVLKKPGRYTAREYDIMKQHVKIGFQMLNDAKLDKMAKNIALYHHEKWDGSGYLKGLKGKKIPLEARIVALSDVYDALVTRRCYKKAYSEKTADTIIQGESGKHFDPKIVSVFMENKKQILKVKNLYYD